MEVVENPDQALLEFFEEKIEAFNLARWDVKKKIPLAVKITDKGGEIVAGAGARTFGNWLLLDNLWVREDQRGKNLGSEILEALEGAAKNRGCRFVLLDTLDFQAQPFYEKRGYRVQWTQENYPRSGCKYFMVKEL